MKTLPFTVNDVHIAIPLEEEDTLRADVAARLNDLARDYEGITAGIVRISQPAGGHDPVRYKVEIGLELGSAQVAETARRSMPQAAVDQAFYELEQSLAAIDEHLRGQVRPEIVAATVDQAGEVVPDVDEALVLQEQEVAPDRLEAATREERLPTHLQKPDKD